jgi:hypothetical protein
MAQLHKRFTDFQVKELMERYLKGEIKRTYLQEIFGIKRRRFCALIKQYRQDPKEFSIRYQRSRHTRTIAVSVEKNILKELKFEQKLIKNKSIPLKSYNYSFIRDRLKTQFNQRVSLPTIIDRAKKGGFYLKKPKRKVHDREVLTNYAGELIQHDSSYHLFAPDSKEKWCLITSIDDFSRYILYAVLIRKESCWAHIMALQAIFLKHGLPFSFYADCHRIFRFIQGRDSLWRKHSKLTDESNPQWRQVLDDCNVKYIPALSPQAKGKVERPYGWMQDHLVRICARENIAELRSARRVLNREVYRYNYQRIHSTTEEVPYFRFQRALKEKKSMFRPFVIKPPFQSIKDIFALRLERTVNSYRKISINNVELKINGTPIGAKINLRIYLNEKTGLSEIRCWYKNNLVAIQRAKNKDLDLVHF